MAGADPPRVTAWAAASPATHPQSGASDAREALERIAQMEASDTPAAHASAFDWTREIAREALAAMTTDPVAALLDAAERDAVSIAAVEVGCRYRSADGKLVWEIAIPPATLADNEGRGVAARQIALAALGRTNIR